MREVEITHALTLDERQRRLLDRHSVLNVLNVVLYQVEQAGALLDDADLVAPVIKWVLGQVSEFRDGLSSSSSDLTYRRDMATIRERLHEGLLALWPRVRHAESVYFERYLDNIESVFDVVDTRVEELDERAGRLPACRTFTLAHLHANLRAAFNAIAKNSLGRYRIAFWPEPRAPGDYLMEFEISSLDGKSIFMPAVIEDVMRDLAANARKYTDPGGWIRVTLVEEVDALCLEVEDTGHGIPEDELEKVIDFGYRGTNFLGRAQRGGGFGLTKAYNVVRELGGRMWVRSGAEEGTRVRIRLPRPSGA
jgi:signal transduction histidine kinase